MLDANKKVSYTVKQYLHKNERGQSNMNKRILAIAMVFCMVLALMPMTTWAATKDLGTGQTLASIGAQSGDIVTIQSGFTGEIKIPTGITNIVLKSNVALAGVYITSVAEVILTIDGLNITAPAGTVGGGPNYAVSDSFAAIDLATGSTLIVEGVNTVTGGMERAGVHVGEGKNLVIQGNGKLHAYGNARSTNGCSGAGVGGDGDFDGVNSNQGKNCGQITIRGNVTLIADKKIKNANNVYLGGGSTNSGSITIESDAKVTADSTFTGTKCMTSSLVISGGAFVCGSMLPAPKNAKGEALNLVDIPTGTEGAIAVNRVGDESFSYTARTQNDGSASIWLPSGSSYEIRVDRGNHTDVYIVSSLADYARSDYDGSVTSKVTLSIPDIQESHDLKVNSVIATPATYNSGTVVVTFNKAPTTAGAVEVSKDSFVTSIPLALQSGDGTAIQTFGYSGLNSSTQYKLRVRDFEDSDGYVNPVHDTGNITTGSAPSRSTSGSTTYTVKFDLNGADGSIVSQTIASGGMAKKPASPTREGYTFTGWYTDKNCTEKYDFDTKVTKQSTLYAGWEKSNEPGVEPWINPFIDVKVDNWFYGDVQYAVENGLFAGTSVTTFSPDMPMTRAMLVTVLWRMEGSPVVDDVGMYANFADVVQDSYYEKAVGWAAKNEIISGYGEGFFGPDDDVTREQFATILYRYIQNKGGGFKGAWAFPLEFTDTSTVSEWAYEALCYCTMHEIITGKPGELLDPQGNATRAEVAAMLHRFMESVK